MTINQKDIRDDIKLSFPLPAGITPSKLEVTLFSMVEKNAGKSPIKDRIWKATWKTEIVEDEVVVTSENMMLSKDGLVSVTFDYAATAIDPKKFDAGWFGLGKLYGVVYLTSADEQMPDKEYSQTITLNIPIQIVNKDTAVGCGEEAIKVTVL